jgi:hypothetical protein
VTDVTLAAFDFLGRIETALSASLSGLDRLAVDDTSRGAGLAASRFPALAVTARKLIRSKIPRCRAGVEIMLHSGIKAGTRTATAAIGSRSSTCRAIH